MIQDGLISYVREHPRYELSPIFKNGQQLIQQLPALEFDILLSDIKLPGSNGFSVCRESKGLFPDRKVLLFSSFTAPAVLIEIEHSKADGFVPKDAGYSALFETIDEVMQGRKALRFDLIEGYHPIQTNSKAGFKLAGHDRILDPFEKFSSLLTSREKELLGYYTKAYSDKSIALHLHISPLTVKTHRKRIFKKLEVNNIQELMLFCWKCGIS